jgi:hypothetical protein
MDLLLEVCSEDDGATLVDNLDNLQLLLREPDASPPNPFTGNSTDSYHDLTMSMLMSKYKRKQVLLYMLVT